MVRDSTGVPPSRRHSGRPAALPAMSHSAMSSADRANTCGAVAAEEVERLRQPIAQPGDVACILTEHGGRELGVEHRQWPRPRRGRNASPQPSRPCVGDDAQPDRVHRLPAEAGHGRGLAAHVEGRLGPVGLDRVIFMAASSWEDFAPGRPEAPERESSHCGWSNLCGRAMWEGIPEGGQHRASDRAGNFN